MSIEVAELEPRGEGYYSRRAGRAGGVSWAGGGGGGEQGGGAAQISFNHAGLPLVLCCAVHLLQCGGDWDESVFGAERGLSC